MLAWLRRTARYLRLTRARVNWEGVSGEVRARHALTGAHIGSITFTRGAWHAIVAGEDVGDYCRAEHAKMAVERCVGKWDGRDLADD